MVTRRNYFEHKISSRAIKLSVRCNEAMGLSLARHNVAWPRPDAEISAREQVDLSGKFETSTLLEKK